MIAIAPFLPDEAADTGPVALSVVGGLARYSLRIAPADAPAASSALGLALPLRIGERGREGAREALLVGPDEWVVHAPAAEGEPIIAAFDGLGAVHSLVDVSDRERTIRLDGAGAADLLAMGCPLDVSRLSPGRGTRTVFDGVTVVVRRDAEDVFLLDVWRSFAPHLWQVLVAGNRELAAGL